MNSTEFREKIKARPRLKHKEYDFNLRWDSFKRTAEYICPGFIVDESNKILYQEACKYFAADESCSWDLNKGCYLVGPNGTGKTLFFKVFHYLLQAPGINSENKFSFLTVNDIVDGFTANGPGYWSSSCITTGQNTYPAAIHIAIDDLGQSSRFASYYGNNIDVVSELIQRRYYAFTDNYVLTHATSNIRPEEINKIFGEFAASRMREMFNIIPVLGEDKRK